MDKITSDKGYVTTGSYYNIIYFHMLTYKMTKKTPKMSLMAFSCTKYQFVSTVLVILWAFSDQCMSKWSICLVKGHFGFCDNSLSVKQPHHGIHVDGLTFIWGANNGIIHYRSKLTLTCDNLSRSKKPKRSQDSCYM